MKRLIIPIISIQDFRDEYLVIEMGNNALLIPKLSIDKTARLLNLYKSLSGIIKGLIILIISIQDFFVTNSWFDKKSRAKKTTEIFVNNQKE